MQRMVTAVRQGNRLLLPLADNPNTNWREHVREQSIPAAPPEGDSTLATAVLAVSLGPILDRDEDGWADANNDKDFLDLNNNGSRDSGEPERVDEDPDVDNQNDFEPGIRSIDDDGWQLERAQRSRMALFDMHKPSIAQVHGHCLAGGTDIVVENRAGMPQQDAVHPAVRQIHDLLYLDVQDGREFYNPDIMRS